MIAMMPQVIADTLGGGPKAEKMSGQQTLSPTATEPSGPTWPEPSHDHALPKRPASSRLRRRQVAGDAIAVLFGIAVAFLGQNATRPVPKTVVMEHLTLSAISLPAFAFGAALTKLARARANERPRQEFVNIVGTVAVGVGAMIVAAFALQFKDLSRLWMLLVALAVTTSLTIERQIARRIFARMRASGALRRRIAIVGTDEHAENLFRTYQHHPELGYEVVGFVGDRSSQVSGAPLLGPVDRLEDILTAHAANGVVVSLSCVHDKEVNSMTRLLTDAGYHVALSTALADIDVTRLRPQQIDGRTMLYVEPVIRSGWRAATKRGFDIVVASTIFVLTLPITLIAMIAIKLDSKGPVLFRQRRIGRDGQPFTMLKLRTMVVDAEDLRDELLVENEMDGPLFKIRNDPRITRVGRVLRKMSIDELPQLLSVIAGTMSMVGPRPALPCELKGWDESLRERLRVLPGLTGLWQISGRSDNGFEEYRRLDLYYVHNWSLAHDLRICARTVSVVLRGRGAS